MLKIHDVTIEQLKVGYFIDQLAELYQLRPVVENCIWHIQQSVFDHTLEVYKSYTEVLTHEFLNLEVRKNIHKHLAKTVDSRDRIELGLIGTLFHDIGKVHTNTDLPSGETSNPFHDFIGAGMFMKVANVFNLTEIERKWVRDFILYHSFVLQTVFFTLDKGEEDKFLSLFRDVVGDMVIDLLLFLLADLKGSDLMKTSPEKYVEIENGIIRLLEREASALS